MMPKLFASPQRLLRLLCAASALCLCPTPGQADTATVANNANTLITTATAQTSPYSLTSGFSPSLTLSLSNAEKWTNLPGTPPNDSARIGPVIGGGSISYNSYELSSTVSSGQTVSPRQAALTLAASTTSTAGYNEMDQIRLADDVLSASGGGNAYNYSDYRADVLNSTTPSTSTDFIIKFAGHHLAYNFTYNFPTFNGSKAYVSASPMFLGLEPPDYQATGNELTTSSTSTAGNAFIVGTNSNTAGTILALYPGTSGTSLTTVTAASAATTLPARTNVTASAIDGATSATYTISAAADSDNGFYYCVVTNGSGSTNSNTVALTIAQTANGNLYQNTSSTGTSPAPVITTQPNSATVTTGTSVTFSVAATSSSTLSYQWYKIATTHRAAMETQRAAVSLLAAAVQADSTLKSSALLSGTFSDIVQGVAGSSGDTGFPATYPTGTTGRGVLFSSMTTAQQTTLKPLIKAMIEAWVNNAPSDAAAVLLADYESDAAINATYVGYANGSGAADSTGVTRCNFDSTINQEKTPQNSQHSYLRIDGPRAWVEMVVQNAVLYQNNGFVHYHSIYRDKLSDYGCEFGSFLNSSATSTTYTRPSFTTQPASATGSSATFTAVATANTASAAVTPAYQWYNSAGAISGATSASYTATAADSYYVTASTAYGTTASNTVTLTAATASAPTITTQPTSLSVVAGDSATFTVAASGSGTLAYQWYKDSVAITGATSASYTIASVVTSDAGTYDCIVTNSAGSATSSAATLTVTTSTGETTPTVTTPPSSESVTVGASAAFTVTATGSGTLAYQWYKDGTAITGATASSYTIAATTTSDAGEYYVTVTNSVGSVTSASAELVVNPVSVPSVNLTAGGDASFFEGSEKGKLVFTRSGGDTTTELTVYYKVKGTAVNGTDYVDNSTGAALSGTLTFPAGTTKVKVKLKGTDDTLASATATVVAKLLASPTGSYTVGSEKKAKLYLSN